MAYLIGMRFCGLQAQERYMLTDSIEGKGFVSYSDYIEKRLRSLDSLPELFVCSNDFCAIDLLQALNRMQLRVPEDVMICGFDDSSMADQHSYPHAGHGLLRHESSGDKNQRARHELPHGIFGNESDSARINRRLTKIIHPA